MFSLTDTGYLSFLLVFFFCFPFRLRGFFLGHLSKLLVFFFLFLFRLRYYSSGHYPSSWFWSPVSLSKLRGFLSRVFMSRASYLEFLGPLFSSPVFLWVRRFFTLVARLSNALYSMEFASNRKDNYIDMYYLAPYLILGCAWSLVI